VGGSFDTAGGSGAGRYLAAWNAAGNSWSSLGSGINAGATNAFVAALLPFNPGSVERLIAGVSLTRRGCARDVEPGMWNGATWEAMGTGWTGSARGSGRVAGRVERAAVCGRGAW
jgi:hypothetical protein